MVDWNLAINVTITGIILVFSMLLLLVFVLSIFGWISVSLKKSVDKKTAKAREEVMAAMSAVKHEEETVSETLSDCDCLNQELVAVISAAVATLYIDSDKKPVIKTIKRSAGRRTAWANAGVLDNTRTF